MSTTEGDLLRKAKQDHSRAASDIVFMEKMMPFIRDISKLDDASGKHKGRSEIREAFINNFLVPKIEESKAHLHTAKVRIEVANAAMTFLGKDINVLTRAEFQKPSSMSNEVLDEIKVAIQYAL